VDPVLDPLLLKNVVGSGIEPGTSGSVARTSDHYTTEAVFPIKIKGKGKDIPFTGRGRP
jgi:hypothetical protein